MGKNPENADKRRAAARYPVDAAVACRPFTSKGDACCADAVMRNFSQVGTYIESAHDFKIGMILQLRMLNYPKPMRLLDPDDRPRSIYLAAVKWRQELTPDTPKQYGFGLKHLD